ncbi:MAG TPA: hypothetical protein DCQ90_00545 [Erysipelotrichaceae bacterium]|nr:hypothetical protein [Erysipelotrichaceae bacterium]
MHKLDGLFATYFRRVAFFCVLVVLTGAPLWIGQIRVGNLLVSMGSTSDLFKLAQESIASSMFATRFLFTYLQGSFSLNSLIVSFVSSFRLHEFLFLMFIVYLATLHPEGYRLKAVRWAAMGVFALQGILYVLAGYSLYSAYYAGSGAQAVALLQTLGFFCVAVSWIEAFGMTLASFIALSLVKRKEID